MSETRKKTLTLLDLAKKIDQFEEEKDFPSTLEINLSRNERIITRVQYVAGKAFSLPPAEFQAALKRKNTFHTLILEGNLGRQGMLALLGVLPETNILHLSLNKFFMDEMTAYEFLIQCKQLKSLELRNTKLSPSVMKILISGLAAEECHLERLLFINVPLEDGLIAELVKGCKDNVYLKSLHLEKCNITEIGARALTELLSPQNKSALSILSVIKNKIGFEGFRSFAWALNDNNTLTILDLRDNQYDEKHAEEVSKLFLENSKYNRTLKCLLLPVGCSIDFTKGQSEDEKESGVEKTRCYPSDLTFFSKGPIAEPVNFYRPFPAFFYQQLVIEMIGEEVLKKSRLFLTNNMRVAPDVLCSVGVYFINFFSEPQIDLDERRELIKYLVNIFSELVLRDAEIFTCFDESLKDEVTASEDMFDAVFHRRSLALMRRNLTEQELESKFMPHPYKNDISGADDYLENCLILRGALKKLNPNLDEILIFPSSPEEIYDYGFKIITFLDEYQLSKLLQLTLEKIIVDIETNVDAIIMRNRTLLKSYADVALGDLSFSVASSLVEIFGKMQENSFQKNIKQQDCVNALRLHIEDRMVELIPDHPSPRLS